MSIFQRIGLLFKTNQREKMEQSIHHAIISQAKRAQYNEDYEQALELYHEAQKITQSTPIIYGDVLLQTADVLIQIGHYTQAKDTLLQVKQIAEVQQLRSLMAYTIVSFGVLAQQQGEIDAARELLERARTMAKLVRSHGAHARANAHLSDLFIAENNIKYAQHLLEESITLMQRSGDTELLAFAYERLGNALYKMGNAQESRHITNKAIEIGIEKRQVALLRKLSIDSAERAIIQEDYATAYHHYTNALKLFPHPERKRVLFINTHILATYSALKLNKVEDATRLFKATEKVAILKPTDLIMVHVYLLDSLRYYWAKDYASAIFLFPDLLAIWERLALDSLKLDAWQCLSLSYFRSGNTDKAHQVINQGIEEMQRAQVPLLQARLLETKGDFHRQAYSQRKDALDTYHQALKLIENQTDVAQTVVLKSKISLCEAILGNGQQAIKYSENALLQLNAVHNPLAKATALENIADVYIDCSDIDTVESLYLQAIDLCPSDENPLQQSTRNGKLGYLYALCGNAEKGVSLLTLARNQSRELGEKTLSFIQTSFLGVAYQYLGDMNTALAHHYETIANLDFHTQIEETALSQLHLAETLLLAKHDLSQTKIHFNHACDYASQTDNRLLSFKSRLGLAKIAILENNPAVIEDILTEIEAGITKSHSKRLIAEFKAVQSEYFALIHSKEKARRVWEESLQLRRLLHMNTLAPTWL